MQGPKSLVTSGLAPTPTRISSYTHRPIRLQSLHKVAYTITHVTDCLDKSLGVVLSLETVLVCVSITVIT